MTIHNMFKLSDLKQQVLHACGLLGLHSLRTKLKCFVSLSDKLFPLFDWTSLLPVPCRCTSSSLLFSSTTSSAVFRRPVLTFDWSDPRSRRSAGLYVLGYALSVSCARDTRRLVSSPLQDVVFRVVCITIISANIQHNRD